MRSSRWLPLAGGIAVLFAVTVAVLLKVIPEPHRNVDYLVIGAVATFLSMVLLWLVLMQGQELVKKRPAAKEDEPGEPG
jgi:Na+/melibiose symporter-like transporter